jgi:uncharacterized protein YybS (DUF2232 family)
LPEQAQKLDALDTLDALDRLEDEPLREVLSLPRAADERDASLGAGWLSAIGLAEGGLLADVGVVLDLASIYLPVVGTLLSFAVPTPFAILMLRRGTRVTLLAAAVAAFLITVFSGPHFGWRMGLEALVGMLLGAAMRARTRPVLAFVGITLLVAAITFAAALGVIFVTGFPISDVVREFRNGLGSAAWLVATGAAVFGFESQWLAVRPTLVALGLLGLHVWPVLLFFSLIVSSMPVVACYYALANATAQVLGHDVRPFPPSTLVRLLRGSLFFIFFPVRGLAWRFRGRPSHRKEQVAPLPTRREPQDRDGETAVKSE